MGDRLIEYMDKVNRRLDALEKQQAKLVHGLKKARDRLEQPGGSAITAVPARMLNNILSEIESDDGGVREGEDDGLAG